MVKGSKFNAWRTVGLAAQAVLIHQMRGVDEIVLLDITATAEGRGPDLDLVTELAEVCFMPLAVGGGIRNVNDARALLLAGADKVVIGTGGPRVVSEVADRVGSQAVVAAIDVRAGQVSVRNAMVNTGCGAMGYAMVCFNHGAGEILLTSVEREGQMGGYDLRLIKEVSDAVDVPVIAHGGAGTYQHMLEAIEVGADAVAAGAMFQFTDQTPLGAARYLAEHGVETRIPDAVEPSIAEGDMDMVRKMAIERCEEGGIPRAVCEALWEKMMGGTMTELELQRELERYK